MKTKESSYIFCINIWINSQTKNEFKLRKETPVQVFSWTTASASSKPYLVYQ